MMSLKARMRLSCVLQYMVANSFDMLQLQILL